MGRRNYSDEEEYEEEREEEQGEREEEEQEEEEEEWLYNKGNMVEEEEEEEQWAYSTCQGNRKALLIGINYFGDNPGELSGCINDVENMYTFITENYGYDPESIRMLRDDTDDPDVRPTRANILEAMEWLVDGAEQNDALFLHYSGHGSQQEDTDGDEKDGIDEALCPVDWQESGLIVDDLLNDLLVQSLPLGCRLTAIFDSCHSGSALDLPYMYNADGQIIQNTAEEDSRQAILDAVDAQNSGDMEALLLSAKNMALVATGASAAAEKKTRREKSSRADVIFFSGCLDNQTSADAMEDGEATGAMSYALIKTLTENSDQTYQEVLLSVRDILREKYTQIPQLSSSHPIDTSLDFVI